MGKGQDPQNGFVHVVHVWLYQSAFEIHIFPPLILRDLISISHWYSPTWLNSVSSSPKIELSICFRFLDFLYELSSVFHLFSELLSSSFTFWTWQLIYSWFFLRGDNSWSFEVTYYLLLFFHSFFCKNSRIALQKSGMNTRHVKMSGQRHCIKTSGQRHCI